MNSTHNQSLNFPKKNCESNKFLSQIAPKTIYEETDCGMNNRPISALEMCQEKRNGNGAWRSFKNQIISVLCRTVEPRISGQFPNDRLFIK